VNILCKYDKLVSVLELIPHPKNNNEHPEDQIDDLAKTMESEGIREPIHVSTLSGFIFKGEGRWLAAKKNGYKEYPVCYWDFQNPEDEYIALTSDNAIGQRSKIDLGKVNLHIQDLGPFEVERLRIPDFVIEPITKYDEENEDVVPEVKESISKPGDIWELGNHRLMCGDSTMIDQVERLMNGEKADMVFTDPPYGVSYQKKNILLNTLQSPKGGLESEIHGDNFSIDELKEMLSQVFSNYNIILKDQSCYYVCSPQGGELGLMMMMMMQDANLLCRHMIIWVKNTPVFSLNRLDYDYRHEPILFGWSKNRTHHKIMEGDFKNSVWEINRELNKLHPTMKPVAIPENAIKNSCPKNGNVADFFGGSGSTLIACEKTNRKCFMMEIDTHYCDVIVNRWSKFTNRFDAKLNGETVNLKEIFNN